MNHASGTSPVTDVTAYVHTHEFPQWYPLLSEHTPRSVWLPWDGAITIDVIMERLALLGNGQVA